MVSVSDTGRDNVTFAFGIKYDNAMAGHQFSMKQLSVSMVGICVGFGGFAFAFRPIDLPIHPSYDRLATIVPVAKIFALVAGTVITCLSAIPLFTHRRPIPVLILMLVGTVVGLITSAVAANTLMPNLRHRGAFENQQMISAVILFSGAAIGSLLPLLLVVMIDRHNRQSREAKKRRVLGTQFPTRED